MILMDIQMPEMDGLEATRRIRHLPRTDASHVPIIALSADAFSEDRKKSIDAGMDEHMSKPFQMADLLSKMRSVILQKQHHVQEKTAEEINR